jgi:DNA-binding MarR family transcriptional regulator
VSPPPGTSESATGALASDLRVVVGQLIRRLRSEHRFSISQAAVLGRLDRHGPCSVSDLAAAEKVRPQSMAQTVSDLEQDGLVERRRDPDDGRRQLVLFTERGHAELVADRARREGWLAQEIERMPAADQRALARAVELLRQIADG